jgi:hypothetical protein
MLSLLLAFHLGSALVTEQGLSSYVGKDLSKLAGWDRLALERHAAGLAGVKNPEYTTVPRWVGPYAADGIAWAYLSLHGSRAEDAYSFSVDVFDADWRHRGRTFVSLGAHMVANERTYADRWIAQPLVEIRVQSEGQLTVTRGKNRHPVLAEDTRQIQTYAIDRLGPHLIRLADAAGRILPNHYEAGSPSIGPDVSKRTVKEWRAALNSADPVRQLDCLIWLGGGHLTSKDWRRRGVSREPVSESQAYERLRKDRRIRAHIDSLCSSKNPWLQAQARRTREAINLPLAEITDPLK